ncbi:MAG: SDR family NAD(P)-dependent oxidoreductase, partial [bacterium]|nr:SDR family NAD(P)-dependent oxidoreductase [bacterium]
MTTKNNETQLTGKEVAIIGMAGRFPGAAGIDEYRDNLMNGVESLTILSDKELEAAGVEADVMNHPNYVKAKVKLEGKEYFDAAFFGYTASEAEVMDPQVRVFHEIAWEALENASCQPGGTSGAIGLYAGASSSTQWEAQAFFSGKSAQLGLFAAAQLANKDFINSRISYSLDLKGPVFSLQTACSTSLVAIHLAVRALLTGECKVALAGGIAVSTAPDQGYMYQEGMILSPDGHCRAFDAEARGTIGGEGGGLVVLKRLKNALEDRDHVYAVIKGTAINNDGRRKVGYTAPSVEAQAEVIRTAQRIARVEPETISYIEAHGTATTLGDPVEIEALTLAFDTEKKGYCAIGSVKTNIGHLDAGAGVAGVIKTALALKERKIPPSLHFKKNNPNINIDNTPFYVNARLKKWTSDAPVLRAGVSSLGIGGTNAHIVLEEAPARAEYPGKRPNQLILLSAKTAPALEKTTEKLLECMKNSKQNNPADIAYTLQVGRKTFHHRKTLVCSGLEDAINTLTGHASANLQTIVSEEEKKTAVFMFPGQGAQYVGMGLGLYQNEPLFREEMDRCFKHLSTLTTYDLKELLYPNEKNVGTNENNGSGNEDTGKINQTEIAQPLLFAVEYSMAKLLIGWGIKPRAMIGHSIGEYAAACLAGVMTLEEALEIVVLRGKLMQQMPTGSMLGVSITEEEPAPLLPQGISLAAVNSPSQCVVSGQHETIEAFEKQLKEKGKQSRRLHTSHAYHSQMMDPVLEPFKKAFDRVTLKKPGIPYISNVTGLWTREEELLKPDYWSTHLRKPVRFAKGLETLLKDKNTLFIEVGPGKALSTFLRQQDTDEHTVVNVVGTMRRPREKTPDDRYLMNRLGQMWLYGADIDWNGYYGAEKKERNRIPLPTYPFQRKKYWIEGDMQNLGANAFQGKALLKKKKKIADWLYEPSWNRTTPLPPEEDKTYFPQGVLVFTDDTGFGRRMVKQLEAYWGQPPVTVCAGTEFSVKEGNEKEGVEYTIEPGKPGHYERLFLQLKANNREPGTILHLWNITGKPGGEPVELTRQSLENAQYKGFYSLVYLAKAVAKIGASRRTDLVVIANHTQEVNGEEKICPAKAALLGPVVVIPQEYPKISSRSIDIELPQPDSQREQTMFRNLLSEISTKKRDRNVAYRGAYRWTQTFKPLTQTIPPESIENDEKRLPLKTKGIVMITGGLGNIGLTLAGYLAENHHARLVLVGRTAFSGKNQWKKKKLQEIEKQGAGLLIKSADVADKEQMTAVVAEVENIWGPINGVIHAAGIVGKQALQAINDIDTESWEKHARPKIAGTMVLEEIFRDKSLQFCLLMSSISTELGGLGFAAYAAANIFMDTFAQRQRQNDPLQNRRWASIDWEGWYFPEQENTGSKPGTPPGLALTATEGIGVFKRILACNHSHLIVSTGDLGARLDKLTKSHAPQGKDGDKPAKTTTTQRMERPQLAQPYEPPGNRQEEQLAGIWEQYFGIEKIGIVDDFFELKGDSLKALNVISKIQDEMDYTLSLMDFFEQPTIKGLSGLINDNRQKKHVNITISEKKEYHPLSPAQKRVYVQYLLDKNVVNYNMPITVVLEGKLDRRRAVETFEGLVEMHESFRTSFLLLGEQPVQVIHENVNFQVEDYNVEGDNYREVAKDFIKPFDLSVAPLLRVRLAKLEEEKHLLMADMHHIVSDGISMGILVADFSALYSGEIRLPLQIQYKDYAQWRKEFQATAEFAKQEAYW